MPFPATAPSKTEGSFGNGDVLGAFYGDNGSFTSDGNGNVTMGTLNPNVSTGTAQAVATGNTIVVPANTTVIRLNPGAAATGVIMPVGSRNGQIVILENIAAAANTITMAASGTSNCANGTSLVVTGLQKQILVWDSVSALWY